MDQTEQSPPLEGGLFRHNYLRPAQPVSDSVRARRRLLQTLWDANDKALTDTFVSHVKSEIGCDYPYSYGWNHTAFWENADVGDVLSAITIWHRITYYKEAYRENVRRIFEDEHLRYRIDEKGGVHFLVDEEFERTVASAVAGLGAPRFAASLHALHEAMTHLGAARQSGKGLIRGVFEAVESAFLAVINQPSADRLNSAAMDRHLKPLLLARYAPHGDAEDLAERFMEHFKAWVKSAHPFRHGTPSEQIHEAPLDLAIMSATQDIGYLRFLAGLQAGS